MPCSFAHIILESLETRSVQNLLLRMMTRIDVQAQRRAKGLFINHPELKKKILCKSEKMNLSSKISCMVPFLFLY